MAYLQGLAMLRLLLLTLCVSIVGARDPNYYGATGRETAQRPNILFILADDLGFHDVGYHGSKVYTPYLDKLSTDGVRLENYYVQPMGSPTRSQLMSGRYQIHNGIQHSVFGDSQPTGLPLDSPTLADKLRESGYVTHMVGKWNLGFHKQEYMPNRRGFDTSYGFLGGHEGHYDHKRRNHLDLRVDGQPLYGKAGRHSTYLFSQRGVDLIEAHNMSKPMFMYMAYQAPHSPLEVPRVFEKLYKRAIRNQDRRKYAAMVTMVDEGVYNLVTALKIKGMWDNTILIFSTDNGGDTSFGGNNYPLRGGKSSLWEGGVRGVALVSGGEDIELRRGDVLTDLMHVTDWFPTLVVGVAGGNLAGTKKLDGVDQWKAISAGGGPPQRTWLVHNIDSMADKKGKRLYPHGFDTRVRAAIRVGDYKLITGNPGEGNWVVPPEMDGAVPQEVKQLRFDEHNKNLWLFNIDEDPEERDDLSSQDPDRVEMMLELLTWINSSAAKPFFPPQNDSAIPKGREGVWGPWV